MALNRLTAAVESENKEATPLNYRAKWFPTNTFYPARGQVKKDLNRHVSRNVPPTRPFLFRKLLGMCSIKTRE